MKKSLPQSNALHLTALPSRGTRFCVRLGAPNKIDRFAHKCSLFPPPAAVTFVARQRGLKRREQAPALPCKLYFLCVGNGLDHSVKHIKLRGQTQFAPTSREQPLCCSVKLHQNLRAGVETRPYKRVVETPTPTHEMECGCPTTPNLSSCAIAKDLTYKRNHICKSFFAERRRMTKAAGFSNFAAFIVCLHTKRKNPDAYASGISGSRYKTNHLPHLLTTSNAVDGERGIIPFRCVYIITADYCNPNTNL